MTPPAPSPGWFPRLRLLARWFRDRRAGRTRRLPWRTAVTFAAALVYFVSPIDFVPDFLFPIVGWIDDAAVFGFVRWVLGRDLRRYLADVGESPAPHGL